MFVLFVTALFLILLVMVQRGKGGGLAGALGGMGGQSAFGTKAGDLFTRVTIGVAAFWIILCTLTVKYLGKTSDILEGGKGGKTESRAPANPGSDHGKEAPTTKPAEKTETPAPAAPGPASSGSPASGGSKPASAK
jgi:preprotein translocase subunit SecG